MPRLAPALTAVLALVVLSASGWSLVRNYRYPKQDFEGAMRFVDRGKTGGDAVVTAGASTYPYQEYYDKHWQSVETPDSCGLSARAITPFGWCIRCRDIWRSPRPASWR